MLFEYLMLLPFGEGEQYLHALKLLKDQELIIGRNRMTFQEGKKEHPLFLMLSRRHVKLLWKGDNEIFITALCSTSNVISVNEAVLTLGKKVMAKEGDHLCLFHDNKCFNYKLLGIQMNPDAKVAPVEEGSETAAVATTQVAEPSEDKSDTDQKQSLGERLAPTSKASGSSGTDEALVSKTECSICLLPLAFAHAIIPCGHHYCYACIFDWSKANTTCPSCQATIVGMNPSHVLNDIIEGVLSNHDDKSTLEDWKERLAEGIAQKKLDTAAVAVASTAAAPSIAAPLTSFVSSSSSSSSASSSGSNILTTLGTSGASVSRKRPLSSQVTSGDTTAIIDLTDYGASDSNKNRYQTPFRSDAIPQQCIAFHIQTDYKTLNIANAGMILKQALDNFDCNSSGLSNACWNPHRRCKHCRHLIAVDTFVVSSVGPPCFQKLFHVQCLSSYNRGLQFMGGGAMERAVTFEKVVNAGSLTATEVTQLRYNTVL